MKAEQLAKRWREFAASAGHGLRKLLASAEHQQEAAFMRGTGLMSRRPRYVGPASLRKFSSTAARFQEEGRRAKESLSRMFALVLHDFLISNRGEILDKTRAKLAT